VRRLGGLLLVATLLAPSMAGAKSTSTLTVFAAASLSDAFGEIGRQMERENQDLQVRFNFAGSNQLALQIESGAQADVFASADLPWMSYLAERERLAGAAQIFAHNRMVAIVPKTNPARIRGLRDFGRRGIKLVLAGEAVPAGQYARAILRNLASRPEFGEDFARRTLANLVSEEENVRAVVTRVQLGEADAGFCYVSDALGPPARYLRTFPIPEEANVLAEYTIAVMKSAPKHDLAEAFVEKVFSPGGQRILAHYGFLPASSPR
jgi:molybdate transport system substrate-binding protein